MYTSLLWSTLNPFHVQQKNPICPNIEKIQLYLLQGKNKTVGRRSTINSQGRSFWDTSILAKGKNRKSKRSAEKLQLERIFSNNWRTQGTVCAHTRLAPGSECTTGYKAGIACGRNSEISRTCNCPPNSLREMSCLESKCRIPPQKSLADTSGVVHAPDQIWASTLTVGSALEKGNHWAKHIEPLKT